MRTLVARKMIFLITDTVFISIHIRICPLTHHDINDTNATEKINFVFGKIPSPFGTPVWIS